MNDITINIINKIAIITIQYKLNAKLTNKIWRDIRDNVSVIKANIETNLNNHITL